VEINQLASKNNIPTIIDIFPYLLFIWNLIDDGDGTWWIR
jgi:hypothetical protein